MSVYDNLLEDVENTNIMKLVEFSFVEHQSFAFDIFALDTELAATVDDEYPSKEILELRLSRFPTPIQYIAHLTAYGSRLYVAIFLGHCVGYINLDNNIIIDELDAPMFTTIKLVCKLYKGLDFTPLMLKKFENIVKEDPSMNLNGFLSRLSSSGRRYAFITEYDIMGVESDKSKRGERD